MVCIKKKKKTLSGVSCQNVFVNLFPRVLVANWCHSQEVKRVLMKTFHIFVFLFVTYPVSKGLWTHDGHEVVDRSL